MSTEKEPEVSVGSNEMELELLRERIRQKKLQRQKDQRKDNPYVVSKTGTYPSKVAKMGNSTLQEQNGICNDKPNNEIDLRTFMEPKGNGVVESISNSNFVPQSDLLSEPFTTRSPSAFGSNEHSNGLYATPDSDFELQNNLLSYAINHPIQDFSQLFAQYRNLTNPIIVSLLNNDLASKFHPMNLIPDTTQESNAFGAQPKAHQVPTVSEMENTSFGQVPLVKPIEPAVSTKPASTFIPAANPSYQKSTTNPMTWTRQNTDSTPNSMTWTRPTTDTTPENPMVWTRQTSSTPTSAPDNADEYVSRVSKGGMTLISKTVYERDEAKFKAVRSNIQAEKAKYQKQKIEHKKKLLEKKRALAKQQRISRNKTKTDFCDRIDIDGEKFAVTANGGKLVILSPNAISIEDKPKSVTWGDNTYVRQSAGNLKTKTQKYVLVITQMVKFY